jgi:hypothetical protein
MKIARLVRFQGGRSNPTVQIKECRRLPRMKDLA